MRLLALDTATRSCSVAVTDGEELRAEVTSVSRSTHSRHLMRMVTMALELSGMTLADMDGFVAGRGPGSFTGLRIGVATVKGLCQATGRPLAGVSNLEALAAQAPAESGRIRALMDARRGEVYCCSYEWIDGRMRQAAPEDVLPPEAAAEDIHGPCLLVGDGARLYADRIRTVVGDSARFASPETDWVRAATLAFLGRRRLLAGEADDPARFVPRYIRKSDARMPA